MCPSIEIDNREEREKLVRDSLHYLDGKDILVYPKYNGYFKQIKVKGVTKNPINTPAVFQYNMSRSFSKKAGKIFNFYIYPIVGEKYINSQSFSNSCSVTDEMVYVETLASVIDRATYYLGNTSKVIQDFYFKNEILSDNDTIKRGLPIYFFGKKLNICANSVNIKDAGFIFELEEAIYRMAVSQLCYYGNKKNNKDANYFTEIVEHISDASLKSKVRKEISICASGTHCFLEDLGVLYFKDKSHLKELYPEYVKTFDYLNELAEKLDFSYIDPDLHFSDIELKGLEDHEPPKYVPYTPVIASHEDNRNSAVNVGYNNQRAFMDQMRSKYAELRFTPDYIFKQIYSYGYTTPNMMSRSIVEQYCNANNLDLDGTPK